MGLRGPNDQSAYTQSQGTPIISSRELSRPGFRRSNTTYGPSALAAARRDAAANRGIVVTVVGENDPFNRFQYFAIVDPAMMPGSNGGSGAGKSGGGVNSGGGANAMQKQFTGGGQGIGLGATDNKNVAAVIEGSFTGMNLAAADTKLPQGKSPDCLNVDGMAVDGAVGPRPGMIMLYPRRYQSLTGTGGAIATNRKGRSLNFLSSAFWQSGQVTAVCTYDTTSIGATGSSVTQTITKAVYPAWNPQHPIEDVKPELTLNSSTTTLTSFRVIMPTRFRRTGNIEKSVNQIIVRASDITYPRDRDGREAFSNVAAGSSLRSAVAWDGTSLTIAELGLTTGTTRYYTVWGLNIEGVTQPARLKVTVA